MSSHIPVWDSTHLEFDDDDITFDNPYEPWENVTKLTKTVTTSIKGIQETLHKEKKRQKTLTERGRYCSSFNRKKSPKINTHYTNLLQQTVSSYYISEDTNHENLLH